MLTQLKLRLERIQETGNKIITELEKDQPSIGNIKELFNQRATQIKELKEIETSGVDKIEMLNEAQKKELKSCFQQIQSIEKKIQQGIGSLFSQKKEALKSVILQNKIKNSYNEGTAVKRSKSYHLDIKSI